MRSGWFKLVNDFSLPLYGELCRYKRKNKCFVPATIHLVFVRNLRKAFFIVWET